MKRLLLMCLILLLSLSAVTVFAGGEPEEAAADFERRVDPDTGRDMIGNMYVSGLPVAKEPEVVRAMVSLHPLNSDILEMEVYQRLEDKTNVQIRGEFILPASWEERKNLVLASGDLPDLFLGTGALSDSDLVRYGPQGLLVPLEDMLEEYAPNFMDVLDRRPEYERMLTTPDGHIYALPTINELLYREQPDVFLINKTWLDRLGLDVPTTTDEFYEVLKAFRDGDPNQSGRRDEIPFSFVYGSTANGIYSFFGSFGVLDNPQHLVVENDRVMFSAIQPEYREGLEYFQMLYSEGLIDPEAFTHDLPQFRAKARETPEVIGAFTTWLDENEVGPDRAVNDYVAVPPLAGPRGDRLWNRYDGEFVMRNSFIITSEARHPELLVRWVNELFEERFALEIARGPFGVTLEELPDGRIEFKPNPPGMGYGEFRFSNAPGDAFPGVVYQEMYERIGLPTGQARKLNEHYPLYRPYFPEQVYPKLFFTPEQERRLAVLQTDIESYVEESAARWIVGDDPLTDQQWQTYLNQLNRMGLDELMAIYQDAYDTFHGIQ